MNQLRTFALTLTLTATLSTSLRAENWPHWRGPEYTGSSKEKNLPAEWTKESAVWVTPMPGYSGATPAIWGDYIFVSSPDPEKNLNLICLNAKDGKVRWQQKVSEGDREKGRNNMTAPSPVTDGKIVVIMYGTGDLAAYDFSGKQLWTRNIGKEYGRIANMWLYGSSPLLYKGKLYVQVLERNPLPPDYTHAIDGKEERESYLLCIDPKTGKNIYRHLRPSDALKESQEAYSSPIPYSFKGQDQIIIVGGNYTTAHDAKTGEEIWRCGGLNSKNDSWWRIVPSPVAGNGFIYSCAPKREPVFAIKEGGKGNVTDSNIAWTFKENPTDVPTPLLYNGKLFVLDGDKYVMTALDPKTGEKKWQGSMGVRETFRSSPTGADGKIYCISENGSVVVLDAGDEFKILSTFKMGEEPIRSSIVAANGHLFIRTGKNLYCVGKK